MNDNSKDIAIVGLSCQFPGCDSALEYWQKLKKNENLISRISESDLRKEGISEDLIRNENYVPFKGIINDIYKFDHEKYGLLMREAKYMDPQQRVMLGCISDAFSGHCVTDPSQTIIGTYLGTNVSSYYLNNILNNPYVNSVGKELPILIGNGHDYFSTRISYLMGYTGPSLTIQTACSTSLVTVHVACQALKNYECDLAIAGGASISFPNKSGYLYSKDSIYSRDAICSPFDAKANGTVFSDGAGVVLLKRLSDAIADKDKIYAVIKGGALNNDGNRKSAYSSPSSTGQAECIGLAYQLSEIDPGTIGYLEAHGTGTAIGDPIEIQALNDAFKIFTNKKGYCKIGSVKANIGHTITAAGIASLIKTALCLNYKTILPMANYSSPNPKIDFDSTPFIPAVDCQAWSSNDLLRAGVSSFGIGGTNVHMILEEYSKSQIFELDLKNINKTDTCMLHQISSVVSLTSKNILEDNKYSYESLRNEKKFNKTEHMIYLVWSDIFETDNININDNLFDLGADSMHLLEIIEQLNVIFGINVTLQELSSFPTIAQFSQVLDNLIKSRSQKINISE